MKPIVNIKKLLYQYDCVIIPGFEGFVKNPCSAELNPFNLTLYPPTARITFNKNLQNNDGLLANYISETENISYAEALLQIKDWVTTTQNDLKENKKVEIDGLGFFHIDINDKLIFTQSKEFNFSTESYGLSPVLAIPVDREKLPEKMKREVKAANIEVQRKTSKAKRYRVAAILMPLLILLVVIPFLIPKGVNSSHYSDMLPFTFLKKATYSEREILETETAESSVSFEFKNELANVPDTIRYISVPLYEGGSSVVVRLKEAEAVTTFVKKTERMSLNSYYVVGGCFSVYENAQHFLNKLQSEGYNASIIGKRKNLFTVVYGTYSTRKEATEQLQAIRENNTSAWLLKN